MLTVKATKSQYFIGPNPILDIEAFPVIEITNFWTSEIQIVTNIDQRPLNTPKILKAKGT